MTIEEKAKAYDEVLERGRKLKKTCDSTAVIGWCEYLVPELKESEDEKIRKEIISYIKSSGVVTNKQWIAWLEKQGKEEYALKSSKDADLYKFMQYIEKQAKTYEFNLPYGSYDIYAFAKDILVWLEKQKATKRYKLGDKETNLKI